MNQNEEKDPKKQEEEDLLELIEQIKKEHYQQQLLEKQQKQQQEKPKKVAISFGFLLHKNYVVHMAMSFGINMILFAVLIGLTSGINQPLLDINVPGFLIGVTLFTLVENFVKILLFKYFARVMILSLGLLSVISQIMILAITDFTLIGFDFIGVEHLIVFSFTFSILRLIFSSYVRRILYGEYLAFFGGKK
jgi:hypothetical protein